MRRVVLAFALRPLVLSPSLSIQGTWLLLRLPLAPLVSFSNDRHTVYMIGQPVPPPVPPPVLSADTEDHLEHIMPSSSVASTFSTGQKTPGTPALTSRSLSFSSASPSPSHNRPPFLFSQSEVYLKSPPIGLTSYSEPQTRLAAARSTGRLDTIYSITSMQSDVDDAFRTAPSSPSEVARRSRHMSVGLIYEGGLGTIAGSPNDDDGEEVEEEYEPTIDLHDPAYDSPTRTSSSTDNALQFTPRPVNPMSHRRVVSSTSSLIRKVEVATSPVISAGRTYVEIGVQTTESPLLLISPSNLSLSPSRGTQSTPTTPGKRAKAVKQGLPTPPATSTSLNCLPHEGSFTSLRIRKRSKSSLALTSPTKFGIACDVDDPVEIRDILQMEDREEAIRELKDLYKKTKHLKEEGERYQNMRVADQAAGLAGVTLACTVLCEELKQNNLAIPVEKLMSRERSLCVPGAEHNLLEMARANKVALDMLSGYTSSGVMRLRNGSTVGLLVPGLSPTPSFSGGMATFGECADGEIALDASRFAMLGKEKDFSMIQGFHASKSPSPATQFFPSPEATAQTLSTDVSSSSLSVPGMYSSSPSPHEHPVEALLHPVRIPAPWPDPGESRLLLRHVDEPNPFLLVDEEARVDPVKEAEKTKRQSELLLDKIEQLEREWSSSKDGMELRKLSELCGPPMYGIMEENEDGEMRPLSVGFPWVTRNPFAETASPVVGDGVQASPLIIEPTQISPKNTTVIFPADAAAILRQFPSFNVATLDATDSQGPEERRRRPLQTKSFLARVETLTNFHLATHLDDEALKLLTDPSPPITPVDATFPRRIRSLSADHSSIEMMSLPGKEDGSHSIATTSVSNSPSSVHQPFTFDDPKWNAYLSPSGSQVQEERKTKSRMSATDSAMLDEATRLLMQEAEDSGSDYGDEEEATEGGK